MKKSRTIREALLPVYALKNVDLLYPKKILDRLMSLSDQDLKSVWNQDNGDGMSPKEIYYGICDYKEKCSSFNNINPKLKTVLEIKYIDVFKKAEADKPISRNYGYRSAYVNWAISKFLLERKDKFWDNSGKFREKVKKNQEYYSFIKKLKKDYVRSYGYLPSVEGINEYLNLKNGKTLDETKPFLYFNWSWAYNEYVSLSIRANKEKTLFKIDLSDAFSNFLYKSIERDIEDDHLFKTIAFINNFNNESKKGVSYGFLIESYFLASYNLTLFKYKFINFLYKEGYETDAMISYVDDNYVSIKNNNKHIGLNDFKKIQEKWNKNNPHEFRLNVDKTEFYPIGSEGRLRADTFTSGGSQFSNYFKEATNEEIKEANISERQKKKIQILKLANKCIKGNFDYSKNKLDILENKYISLFFKQLFNESPLQNIPLFLDKIRFMLKKDPEKLKVADALIFVKLSDKIKQKFIDNFVDSLIQSTSTRGNENKLYTHLNWYPRIENTILKKQNIVIGKSIEKIISSLLKISIKICEICKQKKKSSLLNHEDFTNEKISNISNGAIKLSPILKEFEKWISKETYSKDDAEIVDSSYLAAFKNAIFNLLLLKEKNTLLEQRIKRALSGTSSRKEAATNIVRLTEHIYRYEVEYYKDTHEIKYKPSLWSKVDDSFEEISKILYYSVRNAKNSIRNRTTQFAKWDIIILMRNYVSMAWFNGSRELEHYSNHSLLHCDNLVKAYDDLFGKFYTGCVYIDSDKSNNGALNNDPFVVIMSIYIHDIGLLDDDLFFTKYSFLSGVINLSKQSLKEWYIELRRKMTKAARDNHGETSSLVALEIFNNLSIEKNDIQVNDFHKAALGALLHNASPSHYLGVPLIKDSECFILSLLDLTDSGWDRIGRPYINIGTSTASNDDKMWWMKDLIIESVSRDSRMKDKVPTLEITFNYVDNFLSRIADNFIKTINDDFLEKWKNDTIYKNMKNKDAIKSFTIDKMFKNEKLYFSDKKRQEKGLYLWKDKIGVNVLVKFKKIVSKRGIEYQTIKNKIPWIDEFSTDIKYVKEFLEIK